jgi:hypothetical protein
MIKNRLESAFRQAQERIVILSFFSVSAGVMLFGRCIGNKITECLLAPFNINSRQEIALKKTPYERTKIYLEKRVFIRFTSECNLHYCLLFDH